MPSRSGRQSFLSTRGEGYRFNLSSPLRAEQDCSRLSAYLAFGMIGSPSDRTCNRLV